MIKIEVQQDEYKKNVPFSYLTSKSFIAIHDKLDSHTQP